MVEGEFKIHKRHRIVGKAGEIELAILLPGELMGDEDKEKSYTAT